MNETKTPQSEQELFSKLKHRRLVTVLSGLTGKPSGYLDIQWKNGAIRGLKSEQWIKDVLNDSLENPDYAGTVRYHFGNNASIKLEFLTIE